MHFLQQKIDLYYEDASAKLQHTKCELALRWGDVIEHFSEFLYSSDMYQINFCTEKKCQSLNRLNTSPFKNNLISTFIVWWIPTEIWIFDWLKIIINYKPRVRKLLKEIKTLAVAQKYIIIYA